MMPGGVKSRCLIKFRLISHDIPAVIIQFQVLLAIRDNFLNVLQGTHAPQPNSITHLHELEFGAQVHAGIANR